MICDDDNRHDYSESNDQLLFLDDEDGKEDVEEDEYLDLMLPVAAIHPASDTGDRGGGIIIATAAAVVVIEPTFSLGSNVTFVEMLPKSER